MKTTNLFKALALAALTVVSSFNVEALAQDTNFITNEEVENNLVVAKTIYKQDGNYLYNHMRYEFTYDDANRLVSKTASKWDGTTDKWAPYFQMTYRYESDEIIMSDARWDENRQTFSKDPKQTVYELNEENVPVACREVEDGLVLLAGYRQQLLYTQPMFFLHPFQVLNIL